MIALGRVPKTRRTFLTCIFSYYLDCSRLRSAYHKGKAAPTKIIFAAEAAPTGGGLVTAPSPRPSPAVGEGVGGN